MANSLAPLCLNWWETLSFFFVLFSCWDHFTYSAAVESSAQRYFWNHNRRWSFNCQFCYHDHVLSPNHPEGAWLFWYWAISYRKFRKYFTQLSWDCCVYPVQFTQLSLYGWINTFRVIHLNLHSKDYVHSWVWHCWVYPAQFTQLSLYSWIKTLKFLHLNFYSEEYVHSWI